MKDALKVLHDAMGYVQNGTSQTVTFYQDDATETFHCKAGGSNFIAYNLHDLFKFLEDAYSKEEES